MYSYSAILCKKNEMKNETIFNHGKEIIQIKIKISFRTICVFFSLFFFNQLSSWILIIEKTKK